MVLSAFAFDAPVVATAVGGLPEYVIPGRTRMLVPAGDAGALAAAHEFHWRHTTETLIGSCQAAGRTKH